MLSSLPGINISPFTSHFEQSPCRLFSCSQACRPHLHSTFTSDPNLPRRDKSGLQDVNINNDGKIQTSHNNRRGVTVSSEVNSKSSGNVACNIADDLIDKDIRAVISPNLDEREDIESTETGETKYYDPYARDIDHGTHIADSPELAPLYGRPGWQATHPNSSIENERRNVRPTYQDLHAEPFPVFEDETELQNTQISRKQDCTGINSTPPRVFPLLHAPNRSASQSRHRHRVSEVSSAFLHTLKTASITNGSFSIAPHSNRAARSSESKPVPDQQLRNSTDSDRLPYVSTMRDAGFTRALKRKQIIDELMSTEESYLGDLKALAYLYSTLLASTANISSSLKTSIQRNVTDLVQLHEHIVRCLHKANFRSAARKWADTASPIALKASHHVRWRSAGDRKHTLTNHGLRHPRTSIGSNVNHQALHIFGAADPQDVSDIVSIFGDMMTSFFLYEEYCANHEIIMHHLQKQKPLLWSTYEAGMESLGRLLVAIDQREHQGSKGMTVGDLLIKPVQRVCKYPLLLGDLLRQTPSIDNPIAHEDLESTLEHLRNIVHAVNLATDNHYVRIQIQRRWLIQSRLNLGTVNISAEDFRQLGYIHLCGVLYLTYQSASTVQGCFALCILFDNHLILAKTSSVSGKYDILAIVLLSDLRIESASDGKGIQSQSAHHTWKLAFVDSGRIHEILLSACSTVEEEQWLLGLQGHHRPRDQDFDTTTDISTSCFLDLKSTGTTQDSNVPLSLQTSVQRAATIGNRQVICQVILRNTYNAQDWQEFRNPSIAAVTRSQSHATAIKIVVLAPKRSERVRLEIALADVWTRDKLPYPGMVASKGSQIIRASAGSLVRKLSLASINTRRSEGATISDKRSWEMLHRQKGMTPELQLRKQESPGNRSTHPNEWADLDTMDTVISRMIGEKADSSTVSALDMETSQAKMCKSIRGRHTAASQIGPDDPAAIFYTEKCLTASLKKHLNVQNTRDAAAPKGQTKGSVLNPKPRKRWSNPISRIKDFGSEGFRSILHASR